jgi:uncharacterized membrane protein
MEKNEILKLIVVPAVLTLALVAFCDPFMVLMPAPLALCVLGAFVVAAFAFALFVWKEKARDEREVQLRFSASRIAFLSGAVVLVVAVVYQVLVEHHVDVWVLIALATMALAKTASSLHHLYGE